MAAIVLTENAVEQIQNFAREHPEETRGKKFRIFIQASGCSGYEYGFTFDTERPNDIQLHQKGLDIVIDPKSAKLLEDCVMDYQETLKSSGFVIENPRVKSTCGCGASFEI
ncbi:MAG: iron-sulfur cluster assembly accessory protein [Deltaproteobacteria bacterium]|nr:MAG: iron-sulfur cluster assembly accessory protein [Deltaproteobacteria bacterium]